MVSGKRSIAMVHYWVRHAKCTWSSWNCLWRYATYLQDGLHQKLNRDGKTKSAWPLAPWEKCFPHQVPASTASTNRKRRRQKKHPINLVSGSHPSHWTKIALFLNLLLLASPSSSFPPLFLIWKISGRDSKLIPFKDCCAIKGSPIFNEAPYIWALPK